MAKKPHPFAKKMADAKAAKGKTKSKASSTRKKPTGTPLQRAKARVAKLEAAETKKAAIASARKQIDAGKAALKKARAAK